MTPTPTPKEVANQIQWCYDMLAKNLNGEDMATVRITLRESLKALECDEKRRAALEKVYEKAKPIAARYFKESSWSPISPSHREAMPPAAKEFAELYDALIQIHLTPATQDKT